MKFLRSANDWLFGWGSAATVCLFRILICGLALVNFLMISIDFETWFTERGLQPASFYERWGGGVWRINLLYQVTDERVTLAFYIGVVLLALLSTLGLFSRVVVPLLAIGVVTLHHRSPDILHSGDTLLRNMLIILSFANTGAYYSVDAWLKRRKNPDYLPAEVSLWPQRVMILQLCIVYLTTVLHKANGNLWRDGTAIWYSSNLLEFERFPMPPFTKEMPYIKVATYSTLIVELALTTLVFSKPLRKWVLLAGVALHAGIEYSMNIPLFAVIIVSCYVNFYEGEEVQAWVAKMRAKLPRKEEKDAAATPAPS